MRRGVDGWRASGRRTARVSHNGQVGGSRGAWSEVKISFDSVNAFGSLRWKVGATSEHTCVGWGSEPCLAAAAGLPAKYLPLDFSFFSTLTELNQLHLTGKSLADIGWQNTIATTTTRAQHLHCPLPLLSHTHTHTRRHRRTTRVDHYPTHTKRDS
jgi:hypothetical protein